MLRKTYCEINIIIPLILKITIYHTFIIPEFILKHVMMGTALMLQASFGLIYDNYYHNYETAKLLLLLNPFQQLLNQSLSINKYDVSHSTCVNVEVTT